MGLEAFERALARLATDDDFRARFFAEPAAANELELDPEDLARLLALDRVRLDLLAEQLRTKRYGEVRAQLPRALAALGEPELRERFMVFARRFLPEGVHKHRADALAFAESLGEAGRFDRAALGLFFRLDGRTARARRGPALALTRLNGAPVLLARARDASRYRAFGRTGGRSVPGAPATGSPVRDSAGPRS